MILLFMPAHKTVRHFIPILPAYSLIAAYSLRELISLRFGKIMFIFFAVAGFLHMADILYGTSFIRGPRSLRRMTRFHKEAFVQDSGEIRYRARMLNQVAQSFKRAALPDNPQEHGRPFVVLLPFRSPNCWHFFNMDLFCWQ